MRNVRRFQLDELILRPGTYFNPQTEIMVVVDDSPEVDNEIFEASSVDPSEWVQISDETPLDEHQRDDLIERFQQSNRDGSELGDDDPLDDDEDLDADELDEDEDEDLEDDEEDLDGVDDLEFERE
ncbi:MAG TPA: hypothetical protein VNV44_01250 [Solirubrobacteraceae bacterium]|jgi:hypothetical protein|nr:hypothetical protein [Solirubrobacteraceae bacterium]